MVAVLQNHLNAPLNELSVLNVGGAAGKIDNYLADFFKSVISIDIDEAAIEQAKHDFHKPNLEFRLGDAMRLGFADNSFDVVICSQVYEHVPSPELMMEEIFRVLAPGGICYFAATNRFIWNEPHYNLPLLSAIPRPLAHIYIRLAGKAEQYYELHYSYWGLRHIVRQFILHDYTKALLKEPAKYHIEYMVPPGSLKAAIAGIIAGVAYWLVPGYIWLLEKPGVSGQAGNMAGIEQKP